MSGGLMQIVAQGAQDKYLTQDPEITFFKSMHRRHTNFAIESIEQTFNGTIGENSRVSATISRNGDLVNRMWLEITPTEDQSDLDAYDMIDKISIEIGGTRIDRHTGEWMKLWKELSTPAGKMDVLKKITTGSAAAGDAAAKACMIPLSFWFCKEPGQALPLIALQYHEVKVVVEFGAKVSTAKLWVDYIYLDTEERRRFARSAHEYLIEQVQTTGVESISATGGKVRLNFNHPVKELVWKAGNMESAKLQLNGHDRFAERDNKYFTKVQPYQHHSGSITEDHVKVYSFALEPEKLQPSGTCNFSRIDNATLKIKGTGMSDATVYAVNYNVLRIKNGMGGLAYSN